MPDAHNCCDFGNSGKNKWSLMVAIVAIMAIQKKKLNVT